MEVLILYQYNNQLIDDLCINLSKNCIIADSLNVTTWRFKSKKSKSNPFLISLFRVLCKIPRVNGLIMELFRNSTLISLSKNYDIIDVHFFSSIYDELIDKFKKRGKKVKVTIWGSDFYRSNKIRREKQRKIYQMVDIIQIETTQIADDFLKVFPECAEKVRIAHFGIIQFDIIDELLQNGSSEMYKKELKIPGNAITITCGTNGSEGHQHLLILESLNRLTPEIKAQIFLLIPMTYGGNKSYKKNIRQKAKILGLPYKIFSSFLSIRDISKLRIISDIIITIQKTDALSSAIQEHIYAGSILIAGEWLPYKILSDNGIFYQTTLLDSLKEKLLQIIENIKLLKNNCLENSEKVRDMSSWDAAIKNWVTIFKELAHE